MYNFSRQREFRVIRMKRAPHCDTHAQYTIIQDFIIQVIPETIL